MFEKIKKSELLQGSIILLVMINIYNVLNYLFHFVMVRFLQPAEYGIIATLMAFVYIFAIPSESIQTIISRYTSKLSKESPGKLRFLFEKSSYRGAKLALFIFIFYVILTPLFSYILKIPFYLLGITGLIIFTAFILPIGRGILQGTKRFYSLGINTIIEGSIKLILSFALVYAGLSVLGAISAVVISIVIAFILSVFSFRHIFKYKKEPINLKGIYQYSISVFILVALVVVLLSVDVIIAKIIFPAELVGKYAVASIIGKMIFFGAQPISKSMFPIISERSDTKKDSRDISKKAMLLLILITIPALLVFMFIPNIFVSILFGPKYLDVAPLIILTGVAYTILSLSNLFIMYLLSQKTIKISKMIFISILSILIQFIVLYTSSSSLRTYSISLVFSNLLIFLLIFAILFRK